jgi:geranylgeranyl reductase family protein
MWDLAVVGAGPAGCAAALSALAVRPDLKVVLLDRSEFPRDKSCGDGIAPQVLDVLAEVGIHGVLDDWRPVAQLQLQRGGVTALREMARPAWVVPRAVFDARLVEAAARAGAEVRKLRVRALRTTAEGVCLDTGVSARVVVGADGAHSQVRSAIGVRPVRRHALALRGYAPTPADRAGRQLIVFSETRQPSYAWSFDRGDGLANVGYGELLLASNRPPLSRDLLLRRLEELLPGATHEGGHWLGHHLPLSSWRWEQPDGRVLLAGDAAGLINPLTGEGIYYAVATGLLAGRAVAAALSQGDPDTAGRRHRLSVRSLLARHLRHTALASRLVAVPAVVTRGLIAAERDQRVFDDLVEIGLARGLLTPRIVRHIGLATSVGSRLRSR